MPKHSLDIDAKLKQWEGLVHKVVLKHFNKHHTQYKEYDELINIGLFGLYNAINTYDKDRGASEMSYYYKCIYNEILKVQNYHLNDRRNTKGRTVSIDAYMDSNGESSLDSQVWFTSPSQSDELAIDKGLREVIDTLDETNKTIVSKLELGYSCEEIAQEMGVSRQAIHQRVQNIRKIIDKKWLKFA